MHRHLVSKWLYVLHFTIQLPYTNAGKKKQQQTTTREKKNASVLNSCCLQICKIKYFTHNAIAPVMFMCWYSYLNIWMSVNLLLGEPCCIHSTKKSLYKLNNWNLPAATVMSNFQICGRAKQNQFNLGSQELKEKNSSLSLSLCEIHNT